MFDCELNMIPPLVRHVFPFRFQVCRARIERVYKGLIFRGGNLKGSPRFHTQHYQAETCSRLAVWVKKQLEVCFAMQWASKASFEEIPKAKGCNLGISPILEVPFSTRFPRSHHFLGIREWNQVMRGGWCAQTQNTFVFPLLISFS